jgi:hypothetical protein
MLVDERVPVAAALLGPDAATVLAPAVAAADGAIRSLRPTQARYVPGRCITVRYAARVAWRAEAERIETLCAMFDRRGLPDGLAVAEGPAGEQVGIWRYPSDPFLPGLAQIASPAGAQRVLALLGADAPDVTVEPVVYRPGSRAVPRLSAGAAVLYAKVLRPGAVGPLRATHDALAAAVLVPRCIGWSDELGIVLLEALPERTLARPLVNGGLRPHPRDVLGLLELIAPVPLDAPAQEGSRAVDNAADLLRAITPQALHPTVAAIAEAAGRLPAEAERTIHGDFYEAQVLIDGPRVAGVLDVDGARPGVDHEDPATLIAHLVALAHVRPEAAPRIDAYRRAVEDEVRRRIPATILDAAVAAALLGLATTPFRRQQNEWQEETRAWLALAAGRLGDESSLTRLSPSLQHAG